MQYKINYIATITAFPMLAYLTLTAAALHCSCLTLPPYLAAALLLPYCCLTAAALSCCLVLIPYPKNSHSRCLILIFQFAKNLIFPKVAY
jgi:hypothetical protein